MTLFRSREQAAYAALIGSSLAPGRPLLAGAAAGLGKTHGYTHPLLASGRRVAVALSTRQLIDQFLASDALRSAQAGHPATVAGLRPRRDFASATEHRTHREQALAAQVLVVTHAAALIDSFNPEYAGLRERDVILFDEADLLADAADLRSTFSVVAEGDTDIGRVLARALDADDPEERAAARALRYALDHPAGYKVVGFDGDTLMLKHRMPGRMLRPLVNEARRVIFTSGTLQVSGRFDYFLRALGLEAPDPASRHIDPAHHGELSVEVASSELTDAQKAARILNAQRPALVLTTSHDDTARLGALLPGAVVRGRDEPLVDAVARCGDDALLVAAGAWSGLDWPRLRWRTVLLPKVPYGQPVELSGQPMTHYIDSRVTAVRRIYQGLHRGLRTPEAACRLVILDPRGRRPDLLEAIPVRFRTPGFAEGDEIEKELVKERQRSVSLRPAALKYYGRRCQYPGCEVVEDYKLDVHHLNPIRQGARITRIEDVTVLCKNHHAEAHYLLEAGRDG